MLDAINKLVTSHYVWALYLYLKYILNISICVLYFIKYQNIYIYQVFDPNPLVVI